MRQVAVSMSQEQIIGTNGGAVAAPTAMRPARARLSAETWIKIFVITALFACLFWPNLRRLWEKTNPFYGEANWGHAICIPFIGFYFLYVNRRQLIDPDPLSAPSGRSSALRVWAMLVVGLGLPLILVREVAASQFLIAVEGWAVFAVLTLALCLWRANGPVIESAWRGSSAWFGILLTLFGIELVGYAIYPGQNDFLKDFGMVVTLMGVVMAASSWGVMRIAWFPIAFLVCGIPWPGLMYSRIASPLQSLAANVAVWTLELTGVESSAWGTKIFISGHGGIWRTLNVAEACAGLRSLMTFISVGAAVAFLSNRPLWQKIIVTLSAIPIAIFCNVMRVSGQGLLDHYVSQQLSEDFAHQFVGMIMLIPAFLLILLVGWILDQIFVEEVERGEVMAPSTVIRRGSPAAMAVIARPPPRPAAMSSRVAPPAKIPPPPPIRPAPAVAKAAAAPPVPPAPPRVAPVPPKAAPGPATARPMVMPPPPSVRLASRPVGQNRKAPPPVPPPSSVRPPNPPRKEAV
jgi:exosortase